MKILSYHPKNHLFFAVIISLALRVSAHDPAFRPEFVGTLVPSYLAVQTALANDDLDAAKTGADTFLVAMRHAPDEGDAALEAQDLRKPAEKIKAAEDIAHARHAFHALSMEFATLVGHIGTTGKEELYLMNCPMAFDGRGGRWVQVGDTVSNPYYGASMLRCGTSVRKLAPPDEERPGHDAHKGHGQGHAPHQTPDPHKGHGH